MQKGKSSRIFSTILIVIIVIAVVVGVVSIIRFMSNSGAPATGEKKDVAAEKQQAARDALLTVEEGQTVRVTARGPLIANESFVMQRVAISPDSRSAYVYKGYLGKVERDIKLPNTVKAYDEFVHALDKARFTAQQTKRTTGKEKVDAKDIRGICAKGRVYEYEILKGDEVVYYAWTSTCKGSLGTFGANFSYINSLFTAQIPDGKFEFADYRFDS